MALHSLPVDGKVALLNLACTYAEFEAAHGRALLATRRQEARIAPQEQLFLATYPDVLHWLVLVADDAPETQIILPLLARLTDCSIRVDLRILRETDGFSTLAAVLDDAGASELLSDPDLPLLLIFDDEWQLQEQWGPFPHEMETLLEAWLERHPDFESLAEEGDSENQTRYAVLLDALTWEMRVWFNSGLDRACTQEICELLRGLASDDEGNDDEDDGDEDDGEDELEEELEAL
jgi:hypothetical protein